SLWRHREGHSITHPVPDVFEPGCFSTRHRWLDGHSDACQSTDAIDPQCQSLVYRSTPPAPYRVGVHSCWSLVDAVGHLDDLSSVNAHFD
ncbi:MAG: hypothetical protein ACK56F_26450, partial [bacterium]